MYTLEFAPQALEDLSKNRFIYEIEETVVKVDVLPAYGHYDDK